MPNGPLVERDLKVLWHPCTQMHDHLTVPLIPIRRAHGVWLEDFEGRRYLDAISSWWVNLFGHGHPAINEALRHQLTSLEHVLLAGFTHEPVIELSEALVTLAPNGLTRCFFGDNGSSAVEIALKMSLHYWRNVGSPRKTTFVALAHSYHGETVGALSVSNVALYKETYEALLFKTHVAPSPECSWREPGMTRVEQANRALMGMREILEQHHETICGVIIEPLVQCAGGMRMHDPSYLKGLRALCDKYGVHLIADEIAVGFGRTGTLFACEQGPIRPDFLLLGKGLTGGYLPLSACLTTDEIYEAFFAEYQTGKAFLHSHSYTGNALACAAALATLDIFAKTDTLAANRILSAAMAQALAPLRDHPHVAEVRQTGMIAAVELVADKASGQAYPAEERRGLSVYRYGLDHEALLRPLGDVLYLMPPYVIQEEEIKQVVRVLVAGIHDATAR
ncbi:MAG: adenosylmethionine--8-amino-7-oxononanoate transaminase [Acidiferrobacter sp.]